MNEKAKAFLSRAFSLNAKIDSDQRIIEELKLLAMSISTPGLEVSYNPNNPTEAAFVRYLDKICDMQQKVNAEIDRLVDIKAELFVVIGQVEDSNQQMVLRYRYLHLMGWDEIQAQMGYSGRWVHTLHARALEAVEGLLEAETVASAGSRAPVKPLTPAEAETESTESTETAETAETVEGAR